MRDTDSWFIEGFALGLWQANCYLLGDLDLGTAVVIDPGQGGEQAVTERLAARGVRAEAILLTHGHLDHIWSVPGLAADLDVPVLLHAADRWIWDDPAAAFGNLPPGALKAQFGLDWDPPTERLDELHDGQRLMFSGAEFRVAHTPGHTPGSCVFVVSDLLLSGDLIFAGSVGRTDFPRGSWEQQMSSIERVVLPLPDATEIHSGHGPVTTVGAERAANPFLREIIR